MTDFREWLKDHDTVGDSAKRHKMAERLKHEVAGLRLKLLIAKINTGEPEAHEPENWLDDDQPVIP